MRRHIKTRLITLGESIVSMHDEILKITDKDQQLECFVMCQESAIAIGNTVEENESNIEEKIKILEKYCEEIFNLSQKEEDLNKHDIKNITNIINKFITYLKSIPTKKEVVFFPYKASMWDSLESIWEEFSKKDDCICSVVPIPYSEFQKEENFWKHTYEGEKFPEYVNAIHYSSFDVAEIKPDFGFIHNPYDEYNYVTRVDEDYYSYNLKKHIKNLVYSPYYVGSEKNMGHMAELSAYFHVDYMILNSQEFKDDFKNKVIRDKILPFGSPKFDRVIKFCKEGGTMPEEWKEKAEGKKLIMLNTTISTILNYQSNLLKKLNLIFNELRENKSDVVIVWRPHPLLNATIESMQPHLRKLFNETIDTFVNSDIGILDTTPDITNTLALCDGYMGDGGSSVVNLFGIAGKPIFIFNYNNNFLDEKDTNKRINLSCINKINNEYFGTSSMHGGIFKINNNFSNISYISSIESNNNATNIHTFSVAYENKIYLSPNAGDDFICYDTENSTFEKIGKNKEKVFYNQILTYNDKIIYLPLFSSTIAIYDTKNKSWTYNDSGLNKILKEKPDIPNIPIIRDFVIYNNKLYICCQYSNIITEFDINQKTFQYYNIGDKEVGFNCIDIHEKNIYLAEKKGSIIKLDLETKNANLIQMPKEFKTWINPINQIPALKNNSYSRIISIGNYFILIPSLSNSLVKINKNTNETSLLVPEALKEGFINPENPRANIFPVCNIAYALDNEYLVVQINYTGKFVKINVINETYEFIDLKLEYINYNKFLENINGNTFGFAKNKIQNRFLKLESKHNNISQYLDDISTGKLESIKDIQIQAISGIAENLDGTCGKKVCEFLLKNNTNKNKKIKR